MFLVAAELLQVTVFHHLIFHNVEMSLVLVAVVWYATRVDAVHATAFGLAAGMLEDTLSATTGGAWTISTTTVALVISFISRGFFADSYPLVATITIVATLVRQLVFWIVMGFEGYPSGLAGMHTREALVQCLFNAALMMIVILLSRRIREHYDQ